MHFDSPAQRLRWAREQHGHYKTPTDAARAFGWPISTYLGHENGDRNPSRAAAKRYGRAFRVRWEWLLEGEGSPTEKTCPVRIVGGIGPGSEIVFYPVGKIVTTLELPFGATAHTIAVEVLGGSMRGIADNNWLFFFEDLKNPPTKDLEGRLCFVGLADDKVLCRVLQPGRKKNRYDLESPTEPTLRDQRVLWAAAVTWIKPR